MISLTSAQLSTLNLDRAIGQRKESYKFTLVDGITGETVTELHPLKDNPPTLSHDVSRTIKRTLSPLVLSTEETAIVEPTHHRVRVTMVVAHAEFPLGEYIFTDFTKVRGSNWLTSTSSLSDAMHIVDQQSDEPVTCIRVTNAAFTTYADITEVIKFVVRHLPVRVTAEATSFISVGAWGRGTNRGQILNSLSVDGDYMQPWFDNDGVLRFIRAFDPSERTPDFDWDERLVVIRDSIAEVDDTLTAPSKFLVVSNGSLSDEVVVGTYTVPSSAPHSLVNRGFDITNVIDQAVDNIYQADAIARTIGIRSEVTERVELSTVPDPRHDSHNVIRWRGENWLELAWTLPLTPGSDMRHVMRKAYSR